MILTTDNILLIGSILLFISIIAGKTSYKFGVPVLLFFLSVGMLAGAEGIGKISFNNSKLSQSIGIISLNFILFSGGLETNWKATKPIVKRGFVLSTLGVLLTAVLTGYFVHLITNFTLYEGFLLGAIVSSTDAAAVFSILRSKSLALKGNIRPTLEFESGSNDPMAFFLTTSFLGLITGEYNSIYQLVPFFIKHITIGVLLGLAIGRVGKFIINKIKLDFEGLYPVLVIAIMFFSFSLTNFIGGNGFLAVYVCAIYIGNQEIIHKRTIFKVFDGLAWLMQIVLFLTLGLLVNPSEIIPFIAIGLAISAFMIIIARPLSVFISLAFSKIKSRNKAFIAWVGLRGAVPIVFATYPLLAGIEKSNVIFNIVFFISLTSVLIQGTSLTYMAKLLHVLLPKNIKPKSQVELLLNDFSKSELLEINIADDNQVIGTQIVNLNFPKTSIITMIKRGKEFIVPNGNTIIETNDRLMILSEDKKDTKEIYKILNIYDEQNV